MKSHLIYEWGAFGATTYCGKYITGNLVRRRHTKKCKKCKKMQKKEWFAK